MGENYGSNVTELVASFLMLILELFIQGQSVSYQCSQGTILLKKFPRKTMLPSF